MNEAFAMCSISNTMHSESRTLRRRRSAASASLLSRPSTLTLGELVPSIETCVLVHVTCLASCTPRLKYALFEPNFLIDGASQTVRKLDRTWWERLRSHVEELRIVALSSRCDGQERKPDCMFDLSSPADSGLSKVSLYLQPQSYTAVPARSKDELLEIEIHTPSDERLAAERKSWLPDQVQTVLHDAEASMLQPTPPTSPTLTLPCPPSANQNFPAICDRILLLISHQ